MQRYINLGEKYVYLPENIIPNLTKLGIISAMTVEHEQMCRLLSHATTFTAAHYTFTQGRIGPHEVTLMQCGIGKVNAAVGATHLIAHAQPDAIISTGCAGGIDTCLNVMDVVASSALVYHDVWCGEGNAYGQVQGQPEQFAADARLLAAARSLAKHPEVSTPIHCGLICTGDKFITDRAQLNHIKSEFPEGLAVDMESAAIAHTCHLHNVPFLSFRIISDTPGVEAHWEQYQDFWGEMAHRSFGVTHTFLAQLPEQL